MKWTIFLALALFICFILNLTSTSPASADNFTATDNVSLQFTNNLTLDGVNLTISGGTLDITSSNMTINLIDSENIISDLMAQVFAFLFALLVTALAFWQRNIFLYLLAVPVDLIYGLSFAATKPVASAAWVEGVIVAIIGTFLLYRAAMDEWDELKAKFARRRERD